MLKKRWVFFGFIFLIISMSFVSAENYVNIGWNYNGQWSSNGFVDFTGWKNFVDIFIEVMLNVKVIETNGHLALSSSDNLGNEKIATDLIDFNNQTCKLNFGMNITLPLGNKQRLDYNMILNGKQNICEVIDYKKYLNRTLRDILIDAGSKNITTTFVGNGGNITIMPEKNFSVDNPRFNMTFTHVDKSNFPLVPVSTGNNGTINLTNTELFSLDKVNNGSFVNESTNVGDNSVENNINDSNIAPKNISLNKSTVKELNIINALPENTNISVFIYEKRTLSIDNTDYQTIKWYLDGKIVENSSNKYEFDALKEGNYRIKVEISKNSIVKSNLWSINVVSNKNNLPIPLIIFVFVVLMIVVIMIFIGLWIFNKNSKD